MLEEELEVIENTVRMTLEVARGGVDNTTSSGLTWEELGDDAEQTLRLLSEVRQSREREEKLQRHNIGLYEEMQEVQDILAEALGYALDEEHGWVTGEHTVATLALEAKSKLQGYRRYQ